MEERILKSKTVPEKTFFYPVAFGPEIKKGDDTFKQIDRIVIGTEEPKFADLADWLRDMAQCAEAMSNL